MNNNGVFETKRSETGETWTREASASDMLSRGADNGTNNHGQQVQTRNNILEIRQNMKII